VLEISGEPQRVRAERDACGTDRVRHLIGMATGDPLGAPVALPALRNDPLHVGFDLRQVHDELFMVDDVVHLAAAAGTSRERLEDLLIHVVGRRQARIRMAGLASRLTSVLLALAARERCRLSLRRGQCFVEFAHEVADLDLELVELLSLDLPLQPLYLLLESMAPRTLLPEEFFELALGRHSDLRSRHDPEVDPLRGSEQIRNLRPRRYPRTSLQTQQAE
jgi:hypothetical protein